MFVYYVSNLKQGEYIVEQVLGFFCTFKPRCSIVTKLGTVVAPIEYTLSLRLLKMFSSHDQSSRSNFWFFSANVVHIMSYDPFV